MKKTFVMALCLIGAAATASAQLKIHSNGNMSLHNTDTVALSPMSLNYHGDEDYFMAYQGSLKGIKSSVTNYLEEQITSGYFSSNGYISPIGVYGEASTFVHNLNSGSIGVCGHASNTNYTYSYGVAGSFTGTLGAAIYGTTLSSVSFPDGSPTGRYAGYFDGLTKVYGNFYVSGSVNTNSLLGNSTSTPGLESVMPLNTDRGSISELMSGIRAHTYYQPLQDNRASTVSDSENNMADESEPDLIGEQIHSKMHYTLSADELEKAFPDLVYDEVDGSKRINYLELVPLLVQCINELNGRIQELEGDNAKAETRATLAGSTAIEGTTAKTQAVLYQNTPNPFTAQTEIRFSLPANAPQAYIYIFDMTGKMQKQIPVDASQQSITINGYELQAGIYLYSLVVGGQEIDTKRMIITK